MDNIELLGLLGGVFVLLSFCFKKVLLLRIINSTGAAIFVAYGLIAGAWSIWGQNILVVAINLFYIIRILCQSKVSNKGGNTNGNTNK